MASISDPRLRNDNGAEAPAIKTSKNRAEQLHTAPIMLQTIVFQQQEAPSSDYFSHLQARFG